MKLHAFIFIKSLWKYFHANIYYKNKYLQTRNVYRFMFYSRNTFCDSLYFQSFDSSKDFVCMSDYVSVFVNWIGKRKIDKWATNTHHRLIIYFSIFTTCFTIILRHSTLRAHWTFHNVLFVFVVFTTFLQHSWRHK